MDAPFELVRIHGSEALQTWSALRTGRGVVPVLLGDREALDALLEIVEGNADAPERIRELGLSLDVDGWIESEIEGDPDRFTFDASVTSEPSRVAPFAPAADVLTGKYLNEVYFGLIPVETSWLVPTVLPFGGWNSCPDAAVHLAFFKRWHERYGAEVITLSDDIVELRVSNPPRTKEECAKLAREQYVYCSDVVDQGVQTVGNLAATLLGSDTWYFRWD